MAWVEKRRNGWIVRWHVDGAKKSKYFRFERDARQYARGRGTSQEFAMGGYEAIARLQEGRGGSRKKLTPKLESYARDLIQSDDIGQGSKDGYLSTLKNHLEGSSLGSMRIGDIEPQDIRRFWNQVTPMKTHAKGGEGAKGNVYRLMAKSFNAAVIDQIIPSSPLSRARIKRPSKRRATEVEPLSIQEVEELAAATTNQRDRLAILAGGYCGLRGGEVGGLRKRDIDAKRCRLAIMQAVRRDSTGKHLGLPKGEKARTITIPCSLTKELATLESTDDGRVFYARGGGLMDHTKFTKISQEAAEKAGMAPVNFHALRHTTASLLRSMGADLLQISRYLGHSDPSVTANQYSHLFEHETQDLADRMEAGRQDYLRSIQKLDV